MCFAHGGISIAALPKSKKGHSQWSPSVEGGSQGNLVTNGRQIVGWWLDEVKISTLSNCA